MTPSPPEQPKPPTHPENPLPPETSQPPTNPNPPSNLTEEEKAQAQQSATFFLNLITAESMNSGLIDRLMWFQEFAFYGDEDCGKATTIEERNETYTVTLSHACQILASKQMEAFKVLSGQFTTQGSGESEGGMTVTFKDLTLQIGDRVYIFNGGYNGKAITDGAEIVTQDLVAALPSGESFTFKDVKMITLETDALVTNEISGRLVTSGFKQAYDVSFALVSPWISRYSSGVRPYPRSGQLKVVL